MKTIPLTLGQVALVDDADFDAVNAFKWTAVQKGRTFYALRNVKRPDGTWGHQYLHRFLLPGVPEIHHRDGNGLNNQRDNLRPATHLQNSWGFLSKRLSATSRFRGVSWCSTRLKWEARIKIDGKVKFLGYFDSEEAAARAFDDAARAARKDFAHLNFP